MTRAPLFAALAGLALAAVPVRAQSLDLAVETRVAEAVLQGFERVDSVASMDVDLPSAQRLPFRVDTIEGGHEYLVLVFTTGCPACTMGLELADAGTGQYANATTLHVERGERVNVGRLQVSQPGSIRARMSAFAEGGPHRMLAMLLRRRLE